MLPTGVSPISAAIVEVSGRIGSVNIDGRTAAPPAAMRTTIVSPRALITPSSVAAMIPGSALGNTTLKIVSSRVAPSA